MWILASVVLFFMIIEAVSGGDGLKNGASPPFFAENGLLKPFFKVFKVFWAKKTCFSKEKEKK